MLKLGQVVEENPREEKEKGNTKASSLKFIIVR